MPTGYTDCISKGVTFNQFAWGCARAFGAFIMQRDDASDAPLILEDKAGSYCVESLRRHRDKLAKLEAMTLSQAAVEAEHEANEKDARNALYVKENIDLREKYDRMLREIKAWQPPTPEHVVMKDFMLQQVRDSIKGDCDTSYYDKPVERLPVKEWLAKRIAGEKQDIAYFEKHLAEDEQRAKERTAWKKALVASLGMPEKVK